MKKKTKDKLKKICKMLDLNEEQVIERLVNNFDLENYELWDEIAKVRKGEQ